MAELEAEREACAQMAYEYLEGIEDRLADAIRRRSE